MELIEYCKMAIFELVHETHKSKLKGLGIEQDEVESGTTWPC